MKKLQSTELRKKGDKKLGSNERLVLETEQHQISTR